MATIRFEFDAPTVEELIQGAQSEANALVDKSARARLTRAKIVETDPEGPFHGKFTYRVDKPAS